MKRRRKKEDDLVHRDGALALTFVNTGSRRSPRLESYADLLAWCQQYDGMSTSDARQLTAHAAESPHDADATFATAQELHGLLSTIMNARADAAVPPDTALASLNALLIRMIPKRCLIQGSSSLHWDWPEGSALDLTRPLWSVAISATDLLTSSSYAKVGRCASDDCDVLFLVNRTGSRRKWCDMRSCGNAARTRRYYLRVTKPRKKANDEVKRRSRRSH